ncbi:uncharacterized protein LOC135505702 isoform X1 [Oncorhynchus masou masou]|uniref:uncharacterized protein LOC135505702 isoform X1 n=1 Tax=Oncorhynchus masou masou TaxID=90313 RepID=UPI00318435F9
MHVLVGVSQILATLMFHLAPTQTSHSPVEPHSRVMLFREVLGRSLCRSMERLVEVEQEYPGGVEYIFSPACVPLWRCAGCCGDENLECHPTLTRNVTMQVGVTLCQEATCCLGLPSSNLKEIYAPVKHPMSVHSFERMDTSMHVFVLSSVCLYVCQLMRITPTERTGQYVELTFVEHQTCECRHREMHLNESSPRVRIHPRRRKHRKRSKDCGKCQHPHS